MSSTLTIWFHGAILCISVDHRVNAHISAIWYSRYIILYWVINLNLFVCSLKVTGFSSYLWQWKIEFKDEINFVQFRVTGGSWIYNFYFKWLILGREQNLKWKFSSFSLLLQKKKKWLWKLNGSFQQFYYFAKRRKK